MANVEVADGNNILQKAHAVHHVLCAARPHRSIDNAQDKPQLHSRSYILNRAMGVATSPQICSVVAPFLKNLENFAILRPANVEAFPSGEVSDRNLVKPLRHPGKEVESSPSSLTLIKFHRQCLLNHSATYRWPCLTPPFIFRTKTSGSLVIHCLQYKKP